MDTVRHVERTNPGAQVRKAQRRRRRDDEPASDFRDELAEQGHGAVAPHDEDDHAGDAPRTNGRAHEAGLGDHIDVTA